MGCWEAGARSRMLNLRCPNAIAPCAKTPAASGPLACIELVILDKLASETWPSLLTSPQIPHIQLLRTPLRPTSGACDNPIDNARFHLQRGKKIRTRASPGEVIIGPLGQPWLQWPGVASRARRHSPGPAENALWFTPGWRVPGGGYRPGIAAPVVRETQQQLPNAHSGAFRRSFSLLPDPHRGWRASHAMAGKYLLAALAQSGPVLLQALLSRSIIA